MTAGRNHDWRIKLTPGTWRCPRSDRTDGSELQSPPRGRRATPQGRWRRHRWRPRCSGRFRALRRRVVRRPSRSRGRGGSRPGVHAAVGQTKDYELMSSGELRSVKVGRARRVPRAACRVTSLSASWPSSTTPAPTSASRRRRTVQQTHHRHTPLDRFDGRLSPRHDPDFDHYGHQTHHGGGSGAPATDARVGPLLVANIGKVRPKGATASEIPHVRTATFLQVSRISATKPRRGLVPTQLQGSQVQILSARPEKSQVTPCFTAHPGGQSRAS